jgi:hypothetical protein
MSVSKSPFPSTRVSRKTHTTTTPARHEHRSGSSLSTTTVYSAPDSLPVRSDAITCRHVETKKEIGKIAPPTVVTRSASSRSAKQDVKSVVEADGSAFARRHRHETEGGRDISGPGGGNTNIVSGTNKDVDVRSVSSRSGIVVKATSAHHVWVLHDAECPVWRVPNENGLDKHGWWRHSTIEGVDAFGVLECGATGNCLFDSVLCGLKHNFTGFERWNAAKLRRLGARQITRRTVDAFLQEEIADRKVVGPAPVASHVSSDVECKRGERLGSANTGSRRRHVALEDTTTMHHYAWDPRRALQIKDVEARVKYVRDIISALGNTYWGDALTLRLICRSRTFNELDIGFIVLTPNGVAQVQFITSHDHLLTTSTRHRPATIMILYNTVTHWQLVCHYPDRTRAAWEAVMQLPKTSDDLPTPLRNILVASWGKEWRLTLGYE